MFGLSSTSLLVATAALAVLIPWTLALWWVRRSSSSARARIGLGASVVALVVLAQVTAVGAVFVVVNSQYQFYSSWGDLLGHTGRAATITVNSSSHPGGGTLRALPVDGPASRTHADVLVWLPRQYDEPAYRHRRFPVVMFLPGQPQAPVGAYRGFQLAHNAERAIDSHRVPPFVLVIPPLMVRPPGDTECTNVPRGPKAESWLASDVPRSVTAHLRVDRPGRHWSLIGWSTGGFCAAKLLLRHPTEFAAAVGIGAYYQPITEHVWPHLFGGSARVRNRNSPQWLYERHGGDLHDNRLLMISSRRDPESWPSTRRMIAATRGDPLVSYVAASTGGHNFKVYRRYVIPSLRWLSRPGSPA